MPRIPTYESQVNINSGSIGPRIDPREFSTLSTAVGIVGQQLSAQAERKRIEEEKIRKEQQDRVDDSWIMEKTAEAQKFFLERASSARNEFFDNPNQMADSLHKEFTDYSNKLIGAAPSSISERGRLDALSRLRSSTNSFYKSALEDQQSIIGAKSKQAFYNSFDGLNNVAANGGDLSALRNQLDGNIAASDIDIKLKSDELHESLEKSYLIGMADRGDYKGALSKIGYGRKGGEMGLTPAYMASASPTLLDAIITQESNGVADAISSTGAVGLMQLMPTTAGETAREMGIPYDEGKLRDPTYNKILGTAYLNKMLQRYSGNVMLAAAAYNAGPGAVDQWIKKFGNPNDGVISNTEFAQKIPFKETRNYILGSEDREGVLGRAGIALDTNQNPMNDEFVQTGEMDPNIRFISFGTRMQLKNKFEQELKSAEANKRQLQESDLAQRKAELNDRIKNGLFEISQTGQSSVIPDNDEILNVYPNDPRKAYEIINSIDSSRKFFIANSMIKFASPEQEAAILGAYPPVGMSAEENASRQNMLRDIISEKRKSLLNDPADYLLKNDSALATQFSDVFSRETAVGQKVSDYYNFDTGKLKSAMAAMDHHFDMMGVPQKARQYIPNDAIQAMSRDIMASTPEQMANKIEALEKNISDVSPELWGQTFGRMVKNGIPPDAQFVSILDGPDDVTDRVRFMKFMSVDGKDLKSRFDSGDMKEFDEALSSKLDSFAMTIEPQDPAAFQTYRKGVETLGLSYMLEGKSPSQAAKLAASVLTRKYDIVENENSPFNYRVPRAYDSEIIKKGLSDFVTFHLDANNLDVKSSLPISPELIKKDYLGLIQDNPIWINNETDDGVILLDRAGLPVKSNGNNVEIKFSDAQNYIVRPKALGVGRYQNLADQILAERLKKQ